MSMDQFIQITVDTLAEQIAQANATADKVLTADNSNKLIHEIRETSDDPTIVAFRDFLEKANNRILKEEQAIDAYIVEHGMVDTTPVDVEAETNNYKAVAANVKAMQSTLKTLLGNDDEKYKALNIPEIKSLPGVRKASSNAGGGTGTRRPRLSSITVDYGDGTKVDVFGTKKDDNGNDVHTSTLTDLAKNLSAKYNVKVEVKDLQNDLFAAAKTDDLSTLGGKPVEFPVTIKTEGDTSTIVTVTAVPSTK